MARAAADKEAQHAPGGWWLGRVALVRGLAALYVVGFGVALQQNDGLLGDNGLTPWRARWAHRVARHGGSRLAAASEAPTLLALLDDPTDAHLRALAVVGLCLALPVAATGRANAPALLSLWALYTSIVNVGGTWYGFGWESQLLETGFWAALAVPTLSLRAFDPRSPPSFVGRAAMRWLLFRVMLGAGLIKMRGDQCWRQLTCMDYHYLTQPVPSPTSWYYHNEPWWWHRVETAGNHFVELLCPWLLLIPSRVALLVGGAIQMAFQAVLISSGNLSFLNWLTALPAICCFDDRALGWMFGAAARRQAATAEAALHRAHSAPGGWARRRRLAFNAAALALLAYLSVPVLQNMASSHQAMNTSFDALRLVNTYGAFGSITKTRTEVVLEGTYDDPADPAAVWREYEFVCKPGAVDRRPCLITPWHYRLDWLMWFAAFGSYSHHPWLVHLVAKLLAGPPPEVRALLAHDPFEGGPPPAHVRATHWRYTYPPGAPHATGTWWARERLARDYIPPLSLGNPSLRQFLAAHGWEAPSRPGSAAEGRNTA